jgi:competence protein ComEC
VLKRFRVNTVISANLSDDSALFFEWQSEVETVPGRLHTVVAGQRISMGKDVFLSVLNPGLIEQPGADGGLNSQSVVIRLVMGDVSFLLTGDLDAASEGDLIAHRAALTSTVLKIGHHGSASSTSDGFLAVVDPRAAVISVGKANSYGHPNQDVISRLIQKVGAESIYRTDEQGTVEFVTNGARLWVKTGR